MGVIFIVLAFLVAMGAMMGGGMMGGGTMGAGDGVNSGTFLAVAAFIILAAVAILLALRRGLASPPGPAPPADVGVLQPAHGPPPDPASRGRASVGGGASPSELDALALRLLDRNERLLYLEVKEKGGAALQRDLGHADGFSRSKVTRVLDRLEAKGLVARERDGLTNRVRLLSQDSGDRPYT